MAAHVALTLPNGVKVVVPDRLTLLTPYVLVEQQDWFEDEIRFLRRAVGTGQRVIDIGANYGIYALSLAREVGPQGKVWAFEPSSSTASLLELGVDANGYRNVTVTRCALSNGTGKARFSMLENSEYNALDHGAGTSSADTEEVDVDTLDRCLARWDWRELDLLKIDAEGEEARILEGGQSFFERLSPLVMYEIKAGDSQQLDLVQRFEALGYQSYRLIPGPGVLAPFGAGDVPDAFLLNLFACKPDRAARLREAGLLVERQPTGAEIVPLPRHHWQDAFRAMPYARLLGARWRDRAAGHSSAARTEHVLALHAMSRDATLDATTRWGALSASYRLAVATWKDHPPGVWLSSLGRIAAEAGERRRAVECFDTLIQHLFEQGSFEPDDPFLAPLRRFDALEPRAALGDWFVSALLEARELLGHHSSFYTGAASLPRLEEIVRLGFAAPEMKRRLRLVRTIFGGEAAPGT